MTKRTITLNGRREYMETQFSEAAGLVYHVANVQYNGRLAPALLMAERPYNWYFKLDGRSAEAKELKNAETAMWSAIARYDMAREAAINSKLKGTK